MAEERRRLKEVRDIMRQYEVGQQQPEEVYYTYRPMPGEFRTVAAQSHANNWSSRDASTGLERLKQTEELRQIKLEQMKAKYEKEHQSQMRSKPDVSSTYKLKRRRVPVHQRDVADENSHSHHKNRRENSKKAREVLSIVEKENQAANACSFHPNTSKKTPTKKTKRNETEVYFEEEDPGEIEGVGHRPDELIRWGKEKNARLAALRIEQTSHEVDENCSFAPVVNAKSMKLVDAVSSGEQELCVHRGEVHGHAKETGHRPTGVHQERDQGFVQAQDK